MKLSCVFSSLLLVAVAQAVTVQFYDDKACDSAQITYEGGCNQCYDPPGSEYRFFPADTSVPLRRAPC